MDIGKFFIGFLVPLGIPVGKNRFYGKPMEIAVEKYTSTLFILYPDHGDRNNDFENFYQFLCYKIPI